jgi:pilus assembly protein Flp/PilA
MKDDLFFRFAKNESGATAIEYGLIAAGISIAVAIVVFAIGGKLVNTFTFIDSMLP